MAERSVIFCKLAPRPARRGGKQGFTMWDLIQSVSDPLAWIAIGAFLLAMGGDMLGRRKPAVTIGGFAWFVFGGFWFSMFPYFYFEFQSPLESVLSLAAVPLCFVAGYLLLRGRTSLLLLSRAVGIMGLIYLPAMLYLPLNQFLIETVAGQSHAVMELFGYSPGLEEGPNGYESRFAFSGYSTYIVLACTGIGSIAIFGGLIAATTAPWRRKLLGIGLATGIIWVLNLFRNAFVGIAAPLGWFDYPMFDSVTALLAGEGMRTSFFVAHHLLSQTLAIVALIGIALIVIRIVPEVLEVLDEALFLVTGTEFDLAESVGDQAVRADGGADRESRGL